MKRTILALGLVAFTAPAFAQAADFATADTNGDGLVTMEELKAALPDITAEAATAADTDGDGMLNEEEYGVVANAG